MVEGCPSDHVDLAGALSSVLLHRRPRVLQDEPPLTQLAMDDRATRDWIGSCSASRDGRTWQGASEGDRILEQFFQGVCVILQMHDHLWRRAWTLM